MKRDDELIRQILLSIESFPAGQPISGGKIVPKDVDQAVGAEHLRLLQQAGFIDASFTTYLDDTFLTPDRVRVKHITWRGHEFLNSIRSDTVWAKAKAKVAETSGSVSLSVLGEVAGAIAKGLIGLA